MNRYSNIKKGKLESNDIRPSGINYFTKTVKYPEIPLRADDIYVITDAGDNLVELAYQFYNDTTLYWIISIANPNAISFGSIFITPGTQLRIPINVPSIVDSYNQLNSL